MKRKVTKSESDLFLIVLYYAIGDAYAASFHVSGMPATTRARIIGLLEEALELALEAGKLDGLSLR